MESIITLGIGASPSLEWFITSGLYVGDAAPPVVDAAGFIYAEIEQLYMIHTDTEIINSLTELESIYMIHTDIEPIDTLTEEAETYQVYSED